MALFDALANTQNRIVAFITLGCGFHHFSMAMKKRTAFADRNNGFS
jgi:hypothetical protein